MKCRCWTFQGMLGIDLILLWQLKLEDLLSVISHRFHEFTHAWLIQ